MITKQTEQIHLFLIRHGHTVWNDEDRMRGRKDVALSDYGIRQAQATGEILSNISLDHIYAGPLQRTMITARTIGKYQDLEPESCEGFNDFDFGQWQGMLRSDIKKEWETLYKIYDQTPQKFKAPGGETLDILRTRVMNEMDRIREHHKGQTIAIVSHSVTLQILILAMLGVGTDRYWNLKQGPCCINEILYDLKGYTIVRLNDTHHIEKLSHS